MRGETKRDNNTNPDAEVKAASSEAMPVNGGIPVAGYKPRRIYPARPWPSVYAVDRHDQLAAKIDWSHCPMGSGMTTIGSTQRNQHLAETSKRIGGN